MSKHTPKATSRRKHLILVGIATGCLTVAAVFFLPSSRTQPAAAESRGSNAEAPKVDRDAEFRELVVGTWEQEMNGKRVLTVEGDGSATMVANPSGIWAYTFGEEVRFDVEWTIENGQAKFTFLGGEPSASVAAAIKLWGKDWVQNISTLSEKSMLLVDAESGKEYDWTRVGE